MQKDGILIINKPKGMTSHDVVSRLRRTYNMKKIGHTGTLDPMVDGVMVVCFGRATKLAQYLTDEEKEYYVTVCIGASTTTEDVTGEVLEEKVLTETDAEKIRQEIPELLQSLIGKQEQYPPMYSAVKIDGKKLYEYARNNEKVERKPRTIEIKAIQYNEDTFEMKNGKVYFSFSTVVSKGTYIRTLCVDIGKKLGYPSAMQELQRLASGKYKLDESIELEQVMENVPELIKIDDIKLTMPETTVQGHVAVKLKTGYKLPKYFVEEKYKEPFLVRDAETNKMIGIYQESEKYPDKYESIRII